jgi:transcriptional regulator of acetoin/glycerol metabolism
VERALALDAAAALDDEDRAGRGGTSVDECDPSLPFKVVKERLVARFERTYLERLLAACRGNLSKAARQAGLDRVYLLKLARRHGLRGE